MFQVPPTSEEVGHCDLVEVEEIGDTNVVVFRQGMTPLHHVLVALPKAICYDSPSPQWLCESCGDTEFVYPSGSKFAVLKKFCAVIDNCSCIM